MYFGEIASEVNEKKHHSQRKYKRNFRTHLSRSVRKPIYNGRADYNTNALSYYDYLAMTSDELKELFIDLINRLLRRDIEFYDTDTIDFTKIGSWLEYGECEKFDDVIKIYAEVILALETYKQATLSNIQTAPFIVGNAIEEIVKVGDNDYGLWSPDYTAVLSAINKKIGEMQQQIDNNTENINNLWNTVNNLGDSLEELTNVVNSINNGLQKIINNLYESGAITTNNYNTFEFTQAPDGTQNNVAYGTLNHHLNSVGGNKYIRTRKENNNNTIMGS